MLAFTTRLPLAVMIICGIKQWENRSSLPMPSKGTCAMTVSKSSSAMEYGNFISWAYKTLPPEVINLLPHWEQVSYLPGKLVALCEYDASFTPGPSIWNEGYPVWWHLSNIRLLDEPFPCRGNVGMWTLSESMVNTIRQGLSPQ